MTPQEILSLYGIAAKKITRVDNAILSEVYIIDEKYVLRARSTWNDGLKKLLREIERVNIIRALVPFDFPQNIITPQNSLYIEDADVIWTLYPLIPGKRMGNWWDAHLLSSEERSIFFSSLKTLHQKTLGVFHHPASPEDYNFLEDISKKLIAEKNRLSSEQKDRIITALEYCKQNQKNTPLAEQCFIHSDYHPGNVLMQNGTITGLLDLDWSRQGNPMEDLAYTLSMFLRNYNQNTYTFDITTYEECLHWYGIESSQRVLLQEYLVLYAFFDFCILPELTMLPQHQKMILFQSDFLEDICNRF